MKNNLWNTLQEVEEVKVSFEQTLRNINHIQNRYNMVSALKRKAAKRKEAFEAEIQGCYNRDQSAHKKRVKKTKAACYVNQSSHLAIAPNNTLSENDLVEPFVCLETNCIYEIHKTTTKLVTRKPYGALIRRLYRSAKRKNRQQDQDEDLMCPDLNTYYCSCSSCCVGMPVN
ncbi:LOW QUALITY PROTEIN: uncharacterized protein LOC108102529 [Drosophila eugracilis]|uniref:LOW QUALITY PROTEIN: uncharacterized protein LOC108102529 n=1 Tax=Drosophila eugracilis TaxID=29029 RepID=UPI001BDB13E3|nr:LOW QUALITY PROTEIN: uncharacterized protein LOC108102529 [Drosophila eugracilis]